MTRNLKALGLALLALCALGAMSASGASAAKFTSEVTPTVLTGEQVGTEIQNVFGIKTSSLLVSCKKATFGGTTVGLSVESVKVHATYHECASNFGSAPVKTAGCDYVLHASTAEHKNTATPEVKDGEAGAFDVECTSGIILAIEVPGCTITIGTQTGLQGVIYDNEGTLKTRDIKATIKVDTITYTSHGGLCGLGGIKPHGTDAFLTETVTVKGYEDGEAGSPGTHQHEFKEGSQVGFSYS